MLGDPSSYWVGLALLVLDYTIILLLVPRIIGQRRESGATLAWVFFVVLVPFLGLIAFWLLGTTRLRLRRRKRRRIEEELASRLSPLARPAPPVTPEDVLPTCPDLVALAARLDPACAWPHNKADLFRDGAALFDALEAAIDAARHHVHLTYYIWHPDRTGARMRDALARAAARRVEVRLLVDDVGTKANRRFFRELVEAGGRVERFLPVNLLDRRISLNNRNHRKIVVVDGRVGFTGGMNVGDEYAGLEAPWRDAHVRVEGLAVRRLQQVFCTDWYHTTREDLARPEYFPDIDPAGPVWCQFLASGPDDDRWHSIPTLLFAAVTRACKRVWIETPYFVPDAPMAMALQTAALRGVDVRLVLPGSSDHPLVLYAGRSFYGDLLAAGVKIYELPRAMLHAKTAAIDGHFATVGSANLDQRSFRLNFEANAFFFGTPMAETLERSVEAILREAVPVDPHAFARRRRSRRFLEALARLLAPLL